MKILVIEDDPTATDLLKTRLKNLGCQPLLAANAEDGLRMALEEAPDLVLLDLKLDDDLLSGLNLLRELRSNEHTAQTPVFIHSIFVAHPGDMPEAEALANGFLLKPFKFKDLEAIVTGFKVARSTK